MKLKPKLFIKEEKRGWIGDNPFIFLDTKKIRSSGWKPKYSIDESVRATTKFLIKNSWLLKKLNIIIFGASGSIGNYLLEMYFKNNHNLLLFVKDKKRLKDLKKNIKPKKKKSQIIKFETLDFNKFQDLKVKIKKEIKIFQKTNLIITTIEFKEKLKLF